MKNWLDKSDADVAVISSEFFASVKPVALKKALESHLPDEHYHDLRIIAYVRPHASRFLAAFVQRTKSGLYFGDIDEFLATLQKNEPLTFSYSKRFLQWKKAFGDQFLLKPFIRAELRNGDITEDFFQQVLDGAPFQIATKIEANVSVTTRSLAGLRRMHENLRDLGMKPKTRSLLGGAMGNHFLGAPAPGREKPMLDRNTAEGVVSTFRADARRLDKTFFGKSLMVDDLDRSVNNTRDDEIDLTAEAHFSPSELKALDDLSRSIAADNRLYLRLWALHYDMNYRRAQNYITPLTNAVINNEAAAKKIKAMDDRLYAIADILR